MARRVIFGLKLVDKLVEPVEIDTGSEAERVRDGFRRRVP